MFDSRYETQVRLLIRCLPEIGGHPCFALKGGTAINLFVRNMPRVSVDIDLTYLPPNPRDAALHEINDALVSIKHAIEQRIPGSRVLENRQQGYVVKLSVSTRDATIKIEPNLILRRTIYPSQKMDLCRAAQEHFGVFVSVLASSTADLYGGKLCAALDRQHPRDLFDVKLLLDHGGITSEIRRAFVVYLAGHNRPMNELLSPNIINITGLYQSQFTGMTQEEVSLQELQQLQKDLPVTLVQSLDEDEREFLLSLKRGEPDCNLLGFENLNQFPALQWKLINIQSMSPEKRQKEYVRLNEILSK